MFKESFKDEFARIYGPGEYNDLKNAQKILDSETSWETEVTDFSVLPLSTPMDVEVKAATQSCGISKEVLLDTCDNAGLMLSYNGSEYCLRSCAMPSLLNTAGISGPGVSRVSKEALAVGLTAFLCGSREKSRVMTRSGKVTAVLSQQYEYMPISSLLDICDELEYTFGEIDFRSGLVSHDLTVAEFTFPDTAETVSKAYQSVLASAGRSTTATFLPMVQFRASDTSGEAAKLLTFLQTGTSRIPVGGSKVVHIPPLEHDASGKRLTCMDKFREEANQLFAKLEDEIKDLFPKMLATRIEHPCNTFIKLCKYAGIPRMWGGVVEEDLRASWPDYSGCTFLDIYEALTEVTAVAIKSGQNPTSKRILDLEEGIAKIANNHSVWKRYDLPGLIGWSGKL